MALAVLSGFKPVDQLREGDVNDRQDCVAASLAAAIQWLTGKSVTGRALKDAAYGTAYVGPTSLKSYIDQASDLARRVYGVNAEAQSGEPTALVAKIHTLLRAGYPVIATIPSAWGTARSAAQLDNPTFSTHVICFFEETSGGLGAANPWGAFVHTGSDSYWSARLCYRQIWRVYRIQGGAMGVPDGWKDDGEALHNPVNSFVVEGAKRAFILAHDWDADDVPIGDVENVADVEEANPALGAGNAQTFRMSRLIWANSDGYVRRQWLGQEYLKIRSARDALASQVAALQKQLAAAPQGTADPLAAQSLAMMQELAAAFAKFDALRKEF